VNLAPMSLRLPLLACLLLAAAPAGAGTLYRCTGADGIPNYTGKKVPGAHCEVVANYTAADSRPRGPAPRPAAPVATGGGGSGSPAARVDFRTAAPGQELAA